MTKKQFKAAQTLAEQLTDKIDAFIEDIEKEYPGGFAALIFKRLLKQSGPSDIDDILWELECEENVRVFKISNLVQEMKLEAFLNEIEENPYQLKLIA